MSERAWSLTGSLDADEPIRNFPITSTTFVIGRSRGCDLRLTSNAISSRHAVLSRRSRTLTIKDLDSRNGTFVNGIQIRSETELEDSDRLELGDLVFRVSCRMVAEEEISAQTTWDESGGKTARALAGLERLITSRKIQCYFEPIVQFSDNKAYGHQLHETSKEPGLRSLPEMLLAANQLSLERELGCMLRHAGLTAACSAGRKANLFLNLYPRESIDFRTARTLVALREHFPKAGIIIQISESVATELHTLKFFREVLHGSNIRVAFTQFGSGRSRLFEMCHVQPDYIMFDRSLAYNLSGKSAEERSILAKLVQLAKQMDIVTLADCVDSPQDADLCQSLGFDLGKGSHYGSPVSAANAGFVDPEALTKDRDNPTTSLCVRMEEVRNS